MDVIQLPTLLHPFSNNTITRHNTMKFKIPYSHLLKLSSLWPGFFFFFFFYIVTLIYIFKMLGKNFYRRKNYVVG